MSWNGPEKMAVQNREKIKMTKSVESDETRGKLNCKPAVQAFKRTKDTAKST